MTPSTPLPIARPPWRPAARLGRLALAAFGAMALSAAAGTSALAEATSLRAVSAFNLGTTFSRPFEAFVARVNERGEGVLQIELIGGPEAVPAFEVGQAVQSGIVDIGNVTGAFYNSLLPEVDALKLSERTITELRQNGGWALINQLHNERMNAWYLARHGDGIPFHLYLTRPIDGPDLSGLTIRTTPIYRAMFARLGANLVQTPPGEVFTALERGTIDGYGWPAQGVLDLGWEAHTRYRVDPGFYSVDVNILVNLDTWNGLGDAQKALLNEAAQWIEQEAAGNAAVNADEFQKQAAAGIQTITFQGDALQAWQAAASEAGWAEIEAINADTARALRAVMDAP